MNALSNTDRIELFKFVIKQPFWEELYQLKNNEDWYDFCNSIALNDDEYFNLVEEDFSLEESLILIDKKDSFVNKIIAITCPYETALNKLIDEDKSKHEYGASIKNYITHNRKVPLSILDRLSDDLNDWSLLRGIANNENTNEFILKKLSKNPSKKIILTIAESIAKNKKTPANVLEFLVNLIIEEKAKSKYVDSHIFFNIAKHCNASQETLIKINNNTCSFIETSTKRCLIENPNTPKEIKDILIENYWIKNKQLLWVD